MPDLDVLDALLIVLAGVGAGAINAVVGSGTLITFPTLLALGYPPVVANVSNTIGLVFGNYSGTWGYRRELAGQRATLVRLGTASLIGGVTGALLLLVLPEKVFGAVVPALILAGVVLVLLQPWITRRLAGRPRRPHGGAWVWIAVLLAGVYGGYFGAAQGVILIGILAIGLGETLQRANAAKNLLSLLVNTVAAVVFVLVAEVAWIVSVLLAAGSIAGGLLGASVGRLLPQPVLRGVIAVIGVVAAVRLI